MSSIYISIVTRFSAICLKLYYLYTDIEKSDSMHFTCVVRVNLKEIIVSDKQNVILVLLLYKQCSKKEAFLYRSEIKIYGG